MPRYRGTTDAAFFSDRSSNAKTLTGANVTAADQVVGTYPTRDRLAAIAAAGMRCSSYAVGAISKPAFVQQLAIAVLVNPHWTDATDWVLAATITSVIGLEVGLIDGQETPAMFISDLVNAGSMFTNDKITYKIRHEYGGAVIDWRAFDGSIVAA